jgi:hypothetical protein
LKELLKYDFASGMFIWTGFDYIGEPTPYPFPARSSYFGIVDLAGFPKDAYYLYQGLFTDKDVLHIFHTGIGKMAKRSMCGPTIIMQMKWNFLSMEDHKA